VASDDIPGEFGCQVNAPFLKPVHFNPPFLKEVVPFLAQLAPDFDDAGDERMNYLDLHRAAGPRPRFVPEMGRAWVSVLT
jgi:hypothetical protein